MPIGGWHTPVAMELILIRHGEPVTVQTDGAPADPELSLRGQWQAERVCHWLSFCLPCVGTSFRNNFKLMMRAQSCPQCGIAIIKDGGCPHMKCECCQSDFCWDCLRPYANGVHSDTRYNYCPL